jgi:hypothetical protein
MANVDPLMSVITGALESAMKGIAGTLENIGQLGINGVDAVAGLFGKGQEVAMDMGGQAVGQAVGTVSDGIKAGGAQIANAASIAMEQVSSLASVMGQNPAVAGLINAVKDNPVTLAFENMGDTMKVLAEQGPPMVQAGLPAMGAALGMGAGR